MKATIRSYPYIFCESQPQSPPPHPLQEPPFFCPQVPPIGQPMHFAPRFFALTIYAIAPPRITPSTIIRIAFSINGSFPCTVSSPSLIPGYTSLITTFCVFTYAALPPFPLPIPYSSLQSLQLKSLQMPQWQSDPAQSLSPCFRR